MKHFILTVSLAACLLTPVWSQMGAPNKILEVNINEWPYCPTHLTISNNNQYVIFSCNRYVDSNQQLLSYNSQLTKSWEKKQTSPEASLSGLDGIVAKNGDNGLLSIAEDSLFEYNSEGQITQRLKILGDEMKMIYKDQNHYYVVDFASESNQQVSVYNNDLSLMKRWAIKNHVYVITGFVSDGEYVYIASEIDGGGDSSNISMDLDKYDLEGNIIWTRHLPDRNWPRLCLDKAGNIILFTTLFFHTETNIAWDIIKYNSDGQQLWDKMWLGDYPGDTMSINMVNKDIISCGDGFICIGSSTMLGQDTHSPNFDENRRDAVAIGFDSMGNIEWKIRKGEAGDCGLFTSTQMDKEGYLVIVGKIGSANKIWKYYVPGVTAVASENNNIPEKFSLSQNYPNPFNPSTTIKFSLPKSEKVSLKVYDLLGREVATLVDDLMSAGEHQVVFNSSRPSLPSGIYFYSLISQSFKCTKKMMLLK